MEEAELRPPFWWCLDHQKVEGSDGCANTVRLGPFTDRREAAQALEHAKERTESWDQDPQWNDDPVDSD